MNIQLTQDQNLKNKIKKYISQNKKCPAGEIQCPCQNLLDQGIGPCKCGLYIKTEV